MNGAQDFYLKNLVKRGRLNGLSPDQIRKAVSAAIPIIDPPPIDPTALNVFLSSI
jgi:hypothetical protein